MNVAHEAGVLDAQTAIIRGKPKPVNQREKRKVLEGTVEALLRQIIAWRDGPECVEHGIDGARCNNVLQWGHLITRHNSPWLKYDLATFVQCGSHNYLHDHNDVTMTLWFVQEFGAGALAALNEEARAHKGQKPSLDDLRRMAAHYEELLSDLPRIHTKIALIEMGYYGHILREAWEKEGQTT